MTASAYLELSRSVTEARGRTRCCTNVDVRPSAVFFTARGVVPTAPDDGWHHKASEFSLRGCRNDRTRKKNREKWCIIAKCEHREPRLAPPRHLWFVDNLCTSTWAIAPSTNLCDSGTFIIQNSRLCLVFRSDCGHPPPRGTGAQAMDRHAYYRNAFCAARMQALISCNDY